MASITGNGLTEEEIRRRIENFTSAYRESAADLAATRDRLLRLKILHSALTALRNVPEPKLTNLAIKDHWFFIKDFEVAHKNPYPRITRFWAREFLPDAVPPAPWIDGIVESVTTACEKCRATSPIIGRLFERQENGLREAECFALCLECMRMSVIQTFLIEPDAALDEIVLLASN